MIRHERSFSRTLRQVALTVTLAHGHGPDKPGHDGMGRVSVNAGWYYLRVLRASTFSCVKKYLLAPLYANALPNR
jgi:hypothetical protein